MTRLDQQLSFIVELDKLKSVIRQTLLIDRSRRENSAEHSWHLATMAVVLQEYAEEPVDLLRTIKMLLIHDVVEIDAGDTFAYDTAGYADKDDREQKAAERIFGLLPAEQGREFRQLWEEFEARQTPESKYANALDRLQPLLHNERTEGGTWRIHSVTKGKVIKRMEPIKIGMPRIYPMVHKAIEKACAAGWIKAD
ncbi:MAG TPA: HD domain-containing protein [Terriglobales bacterium]|nr:HD domain-containing protein [Terriglobales bacterium]